jgi:hypothetical protein
MWADLNNPMMALGPHRSRIQMAMEFRRMVNQVMPLAMLLHPILQTVPFLVDLGQTQMQAHTVVQVTLLCL